MQYPDQCNASDPLAPPWCYQQGVENIRQTLDANGDSSKQIWFTEFGSSSGSKFGQAGSEAEQKEHMKRALDILRDWSLNNDAMKIPVAIAYRLEDEDAEEDQFGLYKDGLSSQKPIALEIVQRLDSQGRVITGSGCDASVTLQDNQWAMLSLPCEPPPGTKIGDLFGDDMIINGQPGVYGQHWVVFVYDPERAPFPGYLNPGVEGTLTPGQGFWIVQITGDDMSLDIPSGSQRVSTDTTGGAACLSPTGCVNQSLSGAPNDQVIWNLLGNPFPTGVSANRLRVSALAGPCNTEQSGCTLTAATQANLVHDKIWHYNTGKYDGLKGDMTIGSWFGFWMAELPAAAGNTPVLHIPAPANE
jgi:hypothetical protein